MHCCPSLDFALSFHGVAFPLPQQRTRVPGLAVGGHGPPRVHRCTEHRLQRLPAQRHVARLHLCGRVKIKEGKRETERRQRGAPEGREECMGRGVRHGGVVAGKGRRVAPSHTTDRESGPPGDEQALPAPQPPPHPPPPPTHTHHTQSHRTWKEREPRCWRSASSGVQASGSQTSNTHHIAWVWGSCGGARPGGAKEKEGEGLTSELRVTVRWLDAAPLLLPLPLPSSHGWPASTTRNAPSCFSRGAAGAPAPWCRSHRRGSPPARTAAAAAGGGARWRDTEWRRGRGHHWGRGRGRRRRRQGRHLRQSMRSAAAARIPSMSCANPTSSAAHTTAPPPPPLRPHTTHHGAAGP